MATAHVAHDCIIHNNVIVVNGVTLAGHVEIGEYAIIGGLSRYTSVYSRGQTCHDLRRVTGEERCTPIRQGSQGATYPTSGSIQLGLRRRGFQS